ncbi:hypothetical protein FHS55_000489 [Angulomicrobium tetraedrale]|uniref:Uncharacterized protein n=1 Tax=Ancylobacter tetraedralis TaxID=217068 RepID=A0A839Z4J3_9HYPH|nr:hypothetical protein [Ancylobacter tetraedralis]MBB3769903.1 hypothetical protein [Ancylobacter tetraedralis]
MNTPPRPPQAQLRAVPGFSLGLTHREKEPFNIAERSGATAEQGS